MIGFAEFSRRCNVSALLRYFADIIAYPAERLCRCVSRPPVAALVPRPRLNLIRYLGSFNFDPRSANLNTEMGVIIHDAKLGEFYASELESHYEEFAYVVFKDEKGKIRWLLIALRCRRMAETAAQPVDEILPRQPLRHRHAPDPHGGIYSQADAGNEREEGATPAQRMT